MIGARSEDAQNKWKASLILPLLLMLAVGSLAIRAQASQPQPRTQYEGLDLSSPTAAVETFVDLFQQGDYPALFLVLSAEAQSQWRRHPALTFDYGVWFKNPDETIEAVPMLNRDLPDEHDPSVITALFDEVMVAAASSDNFVIDLRGEVSIIGEETLPAPEVSAAIVTADVEGIDGEVTFILQQSPSQRWRVHQVVVPGGDVDIIPWSAVYETE